MGPPGLPGFRGPAGQSVVSASLAPGHAICAHGGSMFSAVTGDTYACNGAPGTVDYSQAIANGDAPQAASFHVTGAGTVGGALAVGGVIDAPNNLEVVQVGDPRLVYRPSTFTCAAGAWCERATGWGANRFAVAGRYTACEGEADCSGNQVELALDDNVYRTVLLSDLDWTTSRMLAVYVSFDGGATFAFHKAINTQRVTSSLPYVSSIRSLVSNLPLGADVRVRVVAAKGQFHFEGFGLSKLVLPETDAPALRSVARASGAGADTTCFQGSDCFAPIATRVLTLAKTQANTAVRVQYIDNMGVHSDTNQLGSCFWYVRFNGAACPSGDVFGSVYAQPPEFPLRTRTVGGYCTGLSPGTYTVQVYVKNNNGNSGLRCYTGYYDQKWMLEAEEVL